MNKTLVIIDGNSIINRAFYALPEMSNKEGLKTNAIYGFTNMLLKIIDTYNPTHISVAFDRKAPTFRHIEFKEYKAGRKKMPDELREQFEPLKDLLDKFNIHRLEIDGYEADDIIGTVSKIAEDNGFKVYIVTGDKDAIQLASNKTTTLITKKGVGEVEEYNYDSVLERYEMTPTQFIDLETIKKFVNLDKYTSYNKKIQRSSIMSKVLVIGCGGVASVAISKCCQVSDVFTELCIASRTKSKCDALAAKLAPTTRTKITTAQVDADDVQQLCDLINSYKPDLVMNIALPYQDLTIMDACLACGVNYMDTANYEPENTDDPAWRAIYEKRCKEAGFSAYFDYSWQWAYKKKFEDAGLTALLGCGFDPGVTQAYCAYAAKHEFDTIDTIDILDCNGGDHGYAFATNFNPEINLREVSAPGSYMENGKWVEIPPMSIKREYNFDQVGQKDMYLLHHEEIESLGKNLPDVKRIRFFMTFGQSYLDHMRCLEDVGMLSTTPINYNGQEIVPIQFLKALLPDPASLGPRTKGKTNIGCIFTGKKDGKDKTYYIYNVCDHQECYREVGSQAISYTTGVPAMCGALMMLTGEWTKPGVYTVEEFNPDPFLDALDKYGLPRSENHDPVLVD